MSKPQESAYGTEWYRHKHECIKHAFRHDHSYFVKRFDEESCFLFGSYPDRTSYRSSVKNVKKKDLERNWEEIDLTKEVESFRVAKEASRAAKEAAKRETKKQTDDKKTKVVVAATSSTSSSSSPLPAPSSSSAPSNPLSSSSSSSSSSSPTPSSSQEYIQTRVMKSEPIEIPPAGMPTIKMVCRGEKGLLDYLVATRKGELIFTHNERGELEGYLYHSESGMWGRGSELDLKSITYNGLSAVLKECKDHLKNGIEDDTTLTTKYLKKLKKQQRLMLSLGHFQDIWREFTQTLFQASFKERLDKSGGWLCPLNDGKCIDLKTKEIRDIQPTDYFSRCLNVNSSGDSSHPRCRKLFHDTIKPSKNHFNLRDDLEKITSKPSTSTTQPKNKPDPTHIFLKECLVDTDPMLGESLPFKDIYQRYLAYCSRIGSTPLSKKKFGSMMVKYGYNKQRNGNTVVVIDVKFSSKYA